eukprot:TRINITY_DN2741_c0_g2_i1.p1 TRINITY_DN2741_c0_g2~~TRINITY_DN2741_c0_g2_i1.p1  ORF type:complete len:1123 (-),score=302.15 TRINITY_DN2741_c0_g2_i1:79-3447(-)
MAQERAPLIPMAAEADARDAYTILQKRFVDLTEQFRVTVERGNQQIAMLKAELQKSQIQLERSQQDIASKVDAALEKELTDLKQQYQEGASKRDEQVTQLESRLRLASQNMTAAQRVAHERTNELAVCQKQVYQLQEYVKRQQAQLVDLQSAGDVAGTAKQLEAFRLHEQELQTELKRVQTANDALDSAMRLRPSVSDSQQLAVTLAQNEKLVAECAGLQEDLRRCRAVIAEQDDRIVDLSALLESTTATARQHAHTLAELEHGERVQTLTDEIASVRTELVSVQRVAQQYTTAQQQLKDVELKLSDSVNLQKQLQESNSELRTQLTAATASIQKMHTENRATVAKLEQQLAEASRTQESYTAQVQAVRDSIGLQWQEQVSAAERDLLAARQRCAELQTEVTEKSSQCIKITAECMQLRDVIASSDAANARLRDSNADTLTLASTANVENQQLTQKLFGCEQELQQVRAAFAAASETSASTEAALLSMQSDLASANNTISALQQSCATATEALNQRDAQVRELQAQYARLAAAHETLELELQQHKTELQSVVLQRDSMSALLESTQAELNQVKQHAEAELQSNVAMQQQLDTERQQCKSLAEQLIANQQEGATRNTQLQAKAAQLQTAISALEATRHELTAKVALCDELSSRLQGTTTQQQRAEETISALNSRLATQSIDLDTSQATLQRITNDYSSMQLKVVVMEGQLHAAQSRVKAVEHDMQVQTDSLSATNERIAMMLATIKDHVEQNTELSNKIRTLESAGTKQQQQIAAVQSDLSEKQSLLKASNERVAALDLEVADLNRQLASKRAEFVTFTQDLRSFRENAAETQETLHAQIAELEGRLSDSQQQTEALAAQLQDAEDICQAAQEIANEKMTAVGTMHAELAAVNKEILTLRHERLDILQRLQSEVDTFNKQREVHEAAMAASQVQHMSITAKNMEIRSLLDQQNIMITELRRELLHLRARSRETDSVGSSQLLLLEDEELANALPTDSLADAMALVKGYAVCLHRRRLVSLEHCFRKIEQRADGAYWVQTGTSNLKSALRQLHIPVRSPQSGPWVVPTDSLQDLSSHLTHSIAQALILISLGYDNLRDYDSCEGVLHELNVNRFNLILLARACA